MLELVINRGIPGSGKSTYARKWVLTPGTRRARVNRDDIRKQLYGVDFGVPIEETVVTAIEDQMIHTLLGEGVSVIVDDCNISQRYINRFTKIAEQYSAEVRVNLINVDLQTAIDRNQGRERFVPVHVIERMYKQLQGQL
ncbi:polynucleotide kinase [Streptomyces phage Kenrey]|nr:polynucleotide kinase [Streptomyces phage Kenrey]